MKTPFQTLKQFHHSSDLKQPGALSGADLYRQIGYDIHDLTRQNPGYINTCAIRMSLALIRAGVRFSGRLKIKAGPYQGRLIEPGAKLLADQLAKPQLLGRPQRLVNPPQAGINLHQQKGIIFFWKIDGYAGGHIDLIEERNAALICHSHCYFACKEIWFWPLQ